MKKITSVLFCVILTLVVLAGCVASLKRYKPKSPDEAAIKELLIKWEESWNNQDARGVLMLLNERAELMYRVGNDRKFATKREYVDMLLERMKVVLKLKLGAPTIKVLGNKADVFVDIKIGNAKTAFTYYLVKENGGWSIIGWDY